MISAPKASANFDQLHSKNIPRYERTIWHAIKSEATKRSFSPGVPEEIYTFTLLLKGRI
jgi:hypothetical protein